MRFKSIVGCFGVFFFYAFVALLISRYPNIHEGYWLLTGTSFLAYLCIACFSFLDRLAKDTRFPIGGGIREFAIHALACAALIGTVLSTGEGDVHSAITGTFFCMICGLMALHICKFLPGGADE